MSYYNNRNQDYDDFLHPSGGAMQPDYGFMRSTNQPLFSYQRGGLDHNDEVELDNFANQHQQQQQQQYQRNANTSNRAYNMNMPSSPPQTHRTTTTTTTHPVTTNQDHTAVQMHAIGAMNVARRSIPFLAWIYLIWNLIEIVTLSIILGMTWGQQCDEPTIRIIAIARVIRDVVMICVHLRRVMMIPESDFDLSVQSFNRLTILFFFIFSQQWMGSGEQCRKTAPVLYYAGIGVIVLLYLTVLAPILLMLLVCLCLPCVLVVFRWLNIGHGLPTAASDHDIEELSTFQFDPDTFAEPTFDHHVPPPPQPQQSPCQTTRQQQQQQQQQRSPPTHSPSQATAPSLSPVQQRDYHSSPSQPTAPPEPEVAAAVSPRGRPVNPTPTPECSICLCEFDRGEKITQLKCEHIFHQQCVCDWLKINRSCPVCRRDAITGLEQDVSSSRRTLNQFF